MPMCDCRCKCKFKDAVCNDVIFVSHSFRSKCNNFSEFLSLFFHTFNEALFIVVHFILFFKFLYTSLGVKFFVSFFAPSLASLRIFFIFIKVFSSLLFSVHSTMIQPYFTPQFLGTMFSFVLVCAKRSSVQCFSTFLRVLRFR